MKTFLFLLLICVTVIDSVKAQDINDAEGNINISANIIQSIELITVNTISFGNAQPGQSEIYVNPVSDVNAGFMIAVGTPEIEFRLNYEQIRTLTNVDGPGSLTFEYIISANDIEDQASSEILNFDSRSVNFNQEGRFYFWIGGRVNLENAQPGNYEGDLTIEIDYI